MNSRGKEVLHQERRSAWCGVEGGQGEWWWWWRSAEWNWGAQIQAKERLSSGAAHLCWASPKWRVVKSLKWNRSAPDRGRGGDWGAPIRQEERQPRGGAPTVMHYGALNEISKRQSRLRSAHGDWWAPITVEENHGGGVWSSPPCVTDECRGFCSNTIHHRGRAKFTSIFILRNITVNFFPVAYSDSAQWIAAATSANVRGVSGCKNCDVVGCRPKLLAVKKNWW